MSAVTKDTDAHQYVFYWNKELIDL